MINKKSVSKDPNSCCEKLYMAIRNPSPFIRTIRFAKHQHTTNVSNKSPTTSQSDRCVRVTRVGSVSIEGCPRVFKQSVAPTATTASSKKEIDQKYAVIHTKPIATDLPIEGHENRIPTIISYIDDRKSSCITESINSMSSEFIDRTGRKIRSPTNMGARKLGDRHDSFNDRVSEFISKTKDKFHGVNSFNGGYEGKEKRLKDS